MKTFDEIFIDKTKYGVKVQTSEYGEQGEHIIIDQGQSQIAGYTDREDGLFEEVPVVIFGDHTRVIKYVDKPFFLGADGVKVLRSKDERANYKYLYYALKNAKIPNTGYNRHFKWLKEVQIKYPDSDKQAEIVEILDKVSDVIKKREDELVALDELIKARFVELFDGAAGSKLCKMSDVCEDISAGGDRPKDTSDNRTDEYPYPVFANAATNEGLLCFSREYKIDKPCVTIAARGCTVGFTAVRNEKFTPVVRLISLIPNETITPIFLKHYIDMKMNIEGQGAAQPQLTIPMVKTMEIMVPSIDLQYQFIDFVNQVDKSKFAVQKALDEAQLLFDKLMQDYF